MGARNSAAIPVRRVFFIVPASLGALRTHARHPRARSVSLSVGGLEFDASLRSRNRCYNKWNPETQRAERALSLLPGTVQRYRLGVASFALAHLWGCWARCC